MEEKITLPGEETEPIITPPSGSQSFKKHFTKKRVLFTGGAVLVVILIAAGSILLRQTSSPTPSQPFSTKAETSPQLKLPSNTTQVLLPKTPTAMNSYALKTNFSNAQAQKIAQIFNLSNAQAGTNDSIVFSDTINPNNRGILTFNKTTGSISYQSYGILKGVGASPKQIAASFLKTLGIQDGSIVCDITYNKKDTGDVSYVECHRNWKLFHGALVDLPGVLNMSETTLIAQSTPGIVTTNSPLDNSIINISTKQNGYARPTNFNSATFAIQNGRILAMNSNLRWVEPSTSNQVSVISAQDAVNAFKEGKYEYATSIPAGTGTVDFSKVYPHNTAISKTAKISEVTLGYIEKPAESLQSSYTPSYIIRGTSLLDSGYTVRFVGSVAAKSATIGKISGQGSLQIGIIEPHDVLEPSITSAPIKSVPTTIPQPTYSEGSLPTPTPNTPTTIPSPTPSSDTPAQCVNSTAGSQAITIPNYGTMYMQGRAIYAATPLGNTEAKAKAMSALNAVLKQQLIKNVAKWVSQNPNVPVNPSSVIQSITYYLALHPQVQDPRQQAHSFSFDVYPLGSGGPATQGVSEAVGDAMKNGTLAALASAPDLFPPDVVQYQFTNVFIVSPDLATTWEGHECYVTGVSPSLFLYPVHETKLTITSGAQLTYADPEVVNNTWGITARPDGTLRGDQGIARNSLYYEYDKTKTSFRHGSEGWSVSRNNLDKKIIEVGSKLSLNKNEMDALLSDVKKTNQDVDQKRFVTIYLIDEKEIAAKLPLTFSVHPDTLRRIHLLIETSTVQKNLTAPNLEKINRQGFTAIELGVYPQN